MLSSEPAAGREEGEGGGHRAQSCDPEIMT